MGTITFECQAQTLARQLMRNSKMRWEKESRDRLPRVNIATTLSSVSAVLSGVEMGKITKNRIMLIRKNQHYLYQICSIKLT